ncbi:MAG: SLAC1 anion channel family protein, partial [Ginsengibacter sp.]
KIIKYPELVKAEFNHPISVSFFGTFILSLLLIPGLIFPYSKITAICIWALGTLLIFLFAWYILKKWLDHPQDPGNAIPSWAIPVVGVLEVPIVGYRIPITGIHEICVMFFAIGLLFTVLLVTIIFSRLLFQPPMPPALQPTLLILAVPFPLILSDYDVLTGAHDMLTSFLYYSTLFMLLIFGSKVLLLSKSCPFRVTWWAVSFPLAAATIASFRYAVHKQAIIFQIISALLLAVSTVVMGYLLIQTFYRIFTNKLFIQPAAERATEILQPKQEMVRPEA